jgi:hypothetical protein
MRHADPTYRRADAMKKLFLALLCDLSLLLCVALVALWGQENGTVRTG